MMTTASTIQWPTMTQPTRHQNSAIDHSDEWCTVVKCIDQFPENESLEKSLHIPWPLWIQIDQFTYHDSIVRNTSVEHPFRPGCAMWYAWVVCFQIVHLHSGCLAKTGFLWNPCNEPTYLNSKFEGSVLNRSQWSIPTGNWSHHPPANLSIVHSLPSWAKGFHFHLGSGPQRSKISKSLIRSHRWLLARAKSSHFESHTLLKFEGDEVLPARCQQCIPMVSGAQTKLKCKSTSRMTMGFLVSVPTISFSNLPKQAELIYYAVSKTLWTAAHQIQVILTDLPGTGYLQKVLVS